MGILTADALGCSLHASLVWSLASALLLAAALILPRARRMRPVPLCLGLLLLAGIAASWFTWRTAPYASPKLEALLPQAGDDPYVVGMIAEPPAIVSIPKRMGGYQQTRFPIEVSRLNGVPCRGVLQIYVRGVIEGLTYGDEVEVEGRLHTRSAPTNPGEFDYSRYQSRNRISGAIFIGLTGRLEPTGRTLGSKLMRAGWAFKRRCQDAVDSRLPESQATILKCLLMGRTSELEAAQQTAFRETGTLHLLAISGSHIVIVAGFVWLLLTLLGLGPRASAAGVIFVVTGYALLAGLGPGVQRAAIACIVVCGAYLFMRKPDVPTSMALALLAVLALNPADLFNAGLQLSFVAVAGIHLFTLPIERALFGPPDDLERLQAAPERSAALNWLRSALKRSLSLSLAASLATVPLMAYHFQVFTPLAPIATLLLTPAVTLAMIAGLPATLLGTISSAAAWPLFKLAGLGVFVMEWMARAVAQLPGVAQYGPSSGLWLMLFAYAVLAAIACWPRQLWRPWRVAGLLLLPVALYLGLVWRQPAPKFVEVHMLSLGEAQCTVVRFPDGRNLLFDAGGRNMKSGAQVLAPALWSVGVRQIDMVILSHSDEDHCTGFEELARRIPVGCLALPAHFENDEREQNWVERMGRSVRVIHIARGDRIEGFPQARLNMLWPPQEIFFASDKEPNPLCATLDIQTEQGRILLTGDLNSVGAMILAAEEPDLRARVAQVPHHGREDRSSEMLAQAVSPELALVPGGSKMPASWIAHSKRLLATAQCGMISVTLRPDRLDVRTFRNPLDAETKRAASTVSHELDREVRVERGFIVQDFEEY